MNKTKIEQEIIGFFIENGNIVVANPCIIPIEFMEDAVKESKKRTKNKNEVSTCFCIKITNIFRRKNKPQIS